MADDARWYVVHTYSGYEKKVKETIEKVVINRELQSMILEVMYPTEKAVEKDEKGRTKEVEHKVFPGYVLVKMVLTDDTWQVVRNVRGVTGFVGPGSKPVPLSDREAAALGVDRTSDFEVSFKVGDTVKISSGPMSGFIGKVIGIDLESMTTDVQVSMFGRDTLATVDILQVEKSEY